MNFTNRPIVRKPMLDAYGIPSEFDFARYDHKLHIFQIIKSIFQFTVTILILSLCPIIIISSALKRKLEWDLYAGLLWPCFLFGIPLLVWGYKAVRVDSIIKSHLTGHLAYWDRVSAYRDELSAWEFTNTESGLGYWQALRGIAFENAVTLLFRRRGCDVTTTKGSGDGGIDLILSIGGTTFWCQCKGHSKPVPVAPIREIAGVCSREQAVPILLAVNGYTKSAIETANSLGVKCLDANDLCKLARMETITSINSSVHHLGMKA